MSDAIDDDEYVWTSAPFSKDNTFHRGLHDFEKELRCPICKSFFQTPMTIQTCHHTFCSHCIRATIREQTESTKRMAACPECRKPIELSGGEYPLAANRKVETIVKTFAEIRTALFTSLRGVATGDTTTSAAAQPTANSDDSISSPQGTSHSRSTRARRSPPKAATGPEEIMMTNEEDSEGKENSDPHPPPRLKKLPRVFYNKKTKKQLQEKCRELGLSISGTEEQLKDRHKAFVLLYDAERDADRQRSLTELLKVFNDRERAIRDEKRQAMFNGAAEHSASMKRLAESRKAAGLNEAVVVSSGNSKFDKQMDAGFKELTMNMRAKRRMQDKKMPSTEESNAVTESKITLEQVEVNSEPTIHYNSETVTETISVVNSEASARASGDANVSIVELPAIQPQQRPVATIPKSASHDESSCDSKVIVLSEDALSPTTESRKRKSPDDDSSPSIIGPWNCSVCTFHNVNRKWSRAKCEMCGASRSGN